MGRDNKSVRDVRASLTRNRLERPKGWRPPGAMAQVDPNALGPDVRMHWVSIHITKSEQENDRIQQRRQSGWVPVTPEELPAFAYLRDPSTGHLVQNGCILCKNDATEVQMLVEYYEDQALGALEGASGAFVNEDTHRAVTKFKESKMTSLRGRKPS